MVIVKNTDGTRGWTVYSVGTNGGISPEDFSFRLNTTAAHDDAAGYWNDTVPGSVLLTLGDSGDVNADGSTYIAYCFASKQGYSKFGHHIGNGNADGTFVYTGFRPAWLMVKKTSGAEGWYVYDSKRAGYNVDNNSLYPHSSDSAEGTADEVDLLSNGFKWRATSGAFNGDGGAYIYAAFAEAPFVNSNGVPCNAR
jgi:hypothetical protein